MSRTIASSFLLVSFLVSAAGSLRIRATEKVLASTRTYNVPPGANERDATGLYFAGAPVDLAIGPGQATRLQGVVQDDESRTNFVFVEVAGQPVTIRVTLVDASGRTVATKDYDLPAHGQIQRSILDVTASIQGLRNAVLEAAILAGEGRLMAYATQVTNVSQDGSGFEMAYPENWVTSVNGVKGDVTLQAGSNVTIETTPASARASDSSSTGSVITISVPGGGVGPAARRG